MPILALNPIVSGIQTVARVVSDDSPLYTTSDNTQGMQENNKLVVDHAVYNPFLMRNNFVMGFFFYFYSALKISNPKNPHPPYLSYIFY